MTEIFTPDPRSIGFAVVTDQTVRKISIADHHREIDAIYPVGNIPTEVATVFDRARNTMLFAFFEYELWVVGELQAFGAFELAIKFRLDSVGILSSRTLRKHIDRARKHGIIPQMSSGPGKLDAYEALILMRNELSHGSFDIHTPAMALSILRACSDQISYLYPCE